ncbi:TetR family transcriptional regulator [Bacteroidia bacterium]|nr:TetR family transcriptional regulator [Bacteroidia bacterium]GHU70635.1 TetR family transcriptional regulator [Bacteroidia bacterium]
MDLRERIIGETLPLLLKNGIRSMTMSDIANELGISKRTLYEVFRDKTELLEACFNLHISKMDQEIEALKNSSESILDILMRVYAQQLRNMNVVDRSLIYDLRKYYPGVFKKIQCKQKDSYYVVIPLMEKGIREGLIRQEVNLEIVFWLVKAQFKAVLEDDEIPIDKYSPEEVMRTILLNFIRGIVTPEGNVQVDQMIEKIKQEQI